MKRTISMILAIIMLLSLCACGGGGKDNTGKDSEVISGGNSEIRLGDTSSDGYSLCVGENTFSENAEVRLEKAEDDSVFNEPDKYELLSPAAEISCDEFDGAFFATGVTLTLALPEDVKSDDEDLGRYVIVCSDSLSGSVRYFEPDSIDTENGTVTVSLPHFSLWGAAKLTPEEEINMFLDSYSTKLAAEKSGQKQASSELEPYLQAKIDALGLTEDAAKELKDAVIKEIAGDCFDDMGELGAAAYSSSEDDGYQTFCDELDSKITDSLCDMLKSAGAKKAALLFTSVDKTSKIAGYLAGGDIESALETAGSMMEDAIPMGSVITKAVGYVGAKVNETFTYWKANEVEELYQIYKNGAEDFWHNEVIPGDWESMSAYLNCSSGFTKAKAVNRFYNLDKVGEVCKKYGWNYSTYEELPEKYKEEFNRRAEEGLRQYFETRLAEEPAAEKIRADEEVCIKEMTGLTGALRSGMYMEFFGEKDRGDFSLTNRLNRLVKVRAFISRFVDEDALARSAKADAYNYGALLNEWVRLYSENPGDRDRVIELFTAFLKENGLLNPLYKPKAELEGGVDAFMGTWYNDEGRRTILSKSGDHIIEKNPDLPWYGGDVCCTEYTWELDEESLTLILKGITTWVSSSIDSDERSLEMDASISGGRFTASKIEDGKITELTDLGKNKYTR